MANQVTYSTIALIFLTGAAEKGVLVKRGMRIVDTVPSLSPEAEVELRHNALPLHQLVQDIHRKVTKIKRKKIRKKRIRTNSLEAFDEEFPITWIQIVS